MYQELRGAKAIVDRGSKLALLNTGSAEGLYRQELAFYKRAVGRWATRDQLDGNAIGLMVACFLRQGASLTSAYEKAFRHYEIDSDYDLPPPGP